VRHLTQAVFADEIGAAAYERSLSGRSYRDALEGVLERNDGWWCDNKATPAVETCEQLVNAALTAALDELQGGAGQRRRELAVEPCACRALGAPAVQPRQAAGALVRAAQPGRRRHLHAQRVARAAAARDSGTGELYLDEHGPSLRALYDLGDPGQSRFMHSSGQSGIALSPLYRNFVGAWTKVDYVPLWVRPAEHSLVRTGLTGEVSGTRHNQRSREGSPTSLLRNPMKIRDVVIFSGERFEVPKASAHRPPCHPRMATPLRRHQALFGPHARWQRRQRSAR
jgi:penicillin amidase